MKTISIIIGAIALCASQLFAGNPRASVEVEVHADDDYDNTAIWIGPGWYWGIWFDNEVAFNDYRYYHHHYYYDHHGRVYYKSRGRHHYRNHRDRHHDRRHGDRHHSRRDGHGRRHH